MAYSRKRIDPLDLQPRKAIGVNLPFRGPGGLSSTYESKDAIKVNILNYFLTGRNERMLNVDFGAGLRNLLFENATEIGLSEVRESIIESLGVMFPRVIVNKLTLEMDPKTGVIVMHMTYSISETNIQDSLAINFEA